MSVSSAWAAPWELYAALTSDVGVTVVSAAYLRAQEDDRDQNRYSSST